MQTLSSDEERRLLTGVKAAVDLVDNQGHSPDAAMAKVARDCNWSRGELRSAVSAFNNGRQVAQWKANSNVLDKLAEFPLADYEKIAAEIWGGTTKEAADRTFLIQGVDPEYRLPPSWLPTPTSAAAQQALPTLEKTAADAEVHPLVAKHNQQRSMAQAWSRHRDALRDFEGTRTKYASAHDLVRVHVRLLENYFKKSAMDRLSFAAVEDAATAYYGQHGRALFNMLAQSFPREKRAADLWIYHDQPLRRELPPFTYIENCLRAARDVAQAKQAMDAAYTHVKEAEDHLRPFAQTPVPSNPSRIPSPCLFETTEKTAGIGGTLATGMAGAAVKSLIDKATNPADAAHKVDKAWTELEDPEHENELRKIRVQAMLNSMMSDPENPVSGYDPDEVLSRYNELSQLAPRVAEQPAAVAPLLAQRLAGKSQPFEVNEALNIEKGLKDSKVTTPKTRSLLDAPESLLG